MAEMIARDAVSSRNASDASKQNIAQAARARTIIAIGARCCNIARVLSFNSIDSFLATLRAANKI
jgi:hypothetical protein